MSRRLKILAFAAAALVATNGASAQSLTEEQKAFILANKGLVEKEIASDLEAKARERREPKPSIATKGGDLTFAVKEGKRIGLQIGTETVHFNDVAEIAKKDYTDASLNAIQLGYSLALPAMAKIPALEVRQDLIKAEAGMLKEIEASKSALDAALAKQDSSIADTVAKLNSNVADGLAKSKKDVEALGTELTEKLKEDTKTLSNTVAKTSTKVDTEIKRLEEAQKVAVAKLQGDLKKVRVGPYDMTDDHIKLLTGFTPSEHSKYWNGEVLTGSGTGGVMEENRGRKYYRVKYNIRKPGYFSAASMELVAACRALSYHLESKDGVRRDLLPVCDHSGNSRESKCVTLHETYFSHCGCHGCCSIYSWERGCGGLPENKIRYTTMFAEMSWNGNRHLAHQDGACRHTWLDPHKTHSQYQHTLCTSSNDNYKK